MISKIILNGIASYNTEVKIDELKKVNFFFGNNGSGKSTIAKFLYNESLDNNSKSLYYNNCSQVGFESQNNKILVFNEEFIEKNFINSNIQRGIFSLNQGNEAIDTLIENENVILKQNENYKKEILKIDKQNIQDNINKELKELKEKCFKLRGNTLKSFLKIRDSFPYKQTQNNFDEINSIILKNKILNEVKYEDLLAQYRKLYEDDINKINSFLSYKTYKKIRKIEIELNEILNEVIIGNNDVDIAIMIEELGLRKWVETGRDFIVENSKTCPFCQKETIDKGLLEKFENYFDKNYKNKVDKIQLLKINYNEVLKQFLDEINILLNEYNDNNIVSKLEKNIITLHQENLKIIDGKIENTNEKKEIKLIFENKNCISTINKNIKLHNEDFENLDENKNDFKTKIWNYLAFNCKSDIESFTFKEYEESINFFFQLKIEEIINEMISESENKIENWKEQTVTTQDAVNNINIILRNSGFQGFEIEEIEKVNNISKYALKRLINTNNQNVFKSLSEGEKNFIAFLYFFQLCLGTDNSDYISKKKIIVIDDPVSSMDSQVLYIISTLIRKLISKKGTGKDNLGNKLVDQLKNESIEQVFILTHNIFFYKEVALAIGNKICNSVTYYNIKKANNTSYLEVISYKDVAFNDYQLLWDEIKNEKSENITISLHNNMRRIIETYANFMGLINGVDLWSIREDIPEDSPEYLIITSLISQLQAGSHRFSVNDEIYYTRILNESKELALRSFELLFESINGKTHFDKMMS
jgi:wobble nucleotide-excising tRNase